MRLSLCFILLLSFCSINAHAQSINLERHFKQHGYVGTIVLYDTAQKKYIIENPKRAEQGFLPASTYKVFNSLVALESGVVKDENFVIPWDGVKREREEVNHDHTLKSAVEYSVLPYFEEVARRVGKKRMQEYVNRTGYGNQKIGGKQVAFWLTGDMRISARQQVDFLMRLYNNTLPFSLRSMEIVKRILPTEKVGNSIIHAKTGWAQPGDKNLGWWVGWVESKKGLVFFAMNMEGKRPDDKFGEARKTVTLAILKELGYIDL